MATVSKSAESAPRDARSRHRSLTRLTKNMPKIRPHWKDGALVLAVGLVHVPHGVKHGQVGLVAVGQRLVTSVKIHEKSGLTRLTKNP
jgi:hypothetical protein